MLPVSLVVVLAAFHQANAAPESIEWPLFEFWNPVTWVRPKYSTETVTQILRANRNSNRKVYQQLKKTLLPSNIFFGNIRAQFAAWDSGKQKKSKSPGGSRRPNNKKSNKKSQNKQN